MANRWDLLVLHVEDDVAVAPLRLSAAVPLGHKVARRTLARCGRVRKYGTVIGEATAEIAAGEHLHVHNMRTLRARRREEPACPSNPDCRGAAVTLVAPGPIVGDDGSSLPSQRIETSYGRKR